MAVRETWEGESVEFLGDELLRFAPGGQNLTVCEQGFLNQWSGEEVNVFSYPGPQRFFWLLVRTSGVAACCRQRFVFSCAGIADNFMNPATILWIYIVLLIVGGLIGFLKAGSKISLITSSVSAAVLIIASIPSLFQPGIREILIETILAVLLVVFAIRLTKTKKFMPSGLMVVLTLATLALRHFWH